MSEITAIFATIIGLFVLLLGVKSLIRRDFCALCGAVSITWLAFLALAYSGQFENRFIIGVLMGQSVIGVFYYLNGRVSSEWKIFSLPFVLSLTFIASALLGGQVWASSALLLLGGLWVAALAVFLLRRYPRISALAKKAIECCKNW